MRLISITLAVLAAILCAQVAKSDDAPKRSAELQVLDRFVGTWDFVVTNNLAGGETITGGPRWFRPQSNPVRERTGQ